MYERENVCSKVSECELEIERRRIWWVKVEVVNQIEY